ncbi:hypothetical protein BELL_0423g00010 [Botrytis elliptica]|uniref:Uncharacterized protein n=1 Tax=Botrytis elliptica TaxID=278938 RepID=A0A4Z1JN73_9HELO|nr:hypothetical protein EAE99_001766 [Botrytis elliptica]TGO72732.1 hypothetical protein BELL_0423g00010 [Botrytis elliptica]
MSSHPFPHAITLFQSSSQEFDGSQQSRPDSPPLTLPSPNSNHAMENPIQHYYSSLLYSPQLGSSPQSVVYAPLPSQLQVQSQETQAQAQQYLAPPTTSSYSRQNQQAQRNTTSHTQPHSQPESHHHLRSQSIPSTLQTEHQQILNAPHAPELNYNTIASSNQYSVSKPFPDSATRPFPFLFPGLPTLHSSSPYTSTSTSASFSTPPSSCSGSHSDSDPDLETGIEDNMINGLPRNHAQELAVQRAHHMCAWFTGVMLGILGVVGVVRWVVYG